MLEDTSIQNLHEQYVDLVRYYRKEIKSPVIASERMDKAQRASVGAFNEIRSAFEHIARAHSVIYEISLNNSKLSDYEYCTKNFNKAHAHFSRAGFDAYDIIAMALRRDIESWLHDISTLAFQRLNVSLVEWDARYNRALGIVDNVKLTKDVDDREQESEKFELLKEAVMLLASVKKEMGNIVDAIFALETIENTLKTFSKELIYTVCPNASDEIFNKLKEAEEHKDKDKIIEIKNCLEKMKPQLFSLKKEQQKKGFIKNIGSFVVGFVSGFFANLAWSILHPNSPPKG